MTPALIRSLRALRPLATDPTALSLIDQAIAIETARMKQTHKPAMPWKPNSPPSSGACVTPPRPPVTGALAALDALPAAPTTTTRAKAGPTEPIARSAPPPSAASSPPTAGDAPAASANTNPATSCPACAPGLAPAASSPTEQAPRYWLTPPDIYAGLDAEFRFDHDPCPYPRGELNSLDPAVPWGQVNYVNPPFVRADGPHGGPSAFVRRAIQERDQRGSTSVIILPVPHSIALLLAAGAELRDGGPVRWLDAATRKPCPRARPQIIAILRPPPA